MRNDRTADCLSFGDALFLHLERAGAPLHVSALCVFEGEITLDMCRRYIASKLPSIPRYLQVVVPPPFGLGVPVWEFTNAFDLRHHVREISLKRGTESELKSFVAEILSTNLDRRRPLWDFVLFSGLKGNRTAVLIRVHHCLVDGIAGVGLMQVLFDPSPATKKLPKAKYHFEVPPHRSQATQVLDGFVTTFFTAIERLLTADSGLITLAQQMASAAGSAPLVSFNGDTNGGAPPDFQKLNKFLPEFASATDRLPFNTLCRGPQKFRWAEIPFADIRAIKKACNTTVNDVFLTLMTMTIARYAESKQVSTDERLLRIVVPVNVRGKDDRSGLGNQITFLPVTVPMGIEDPRQLLIGVHDRVEVLKRLRLAELVGLAGTLMGTIPTAAQAILAPMISQLQISLCNFICTNVPGPQVPLYLHGHRLLACYPYVPIGGEMGMNCAILTYDNTAFFGFTGDAKAIPEIDLLPKFLVDSFKELRGAALGKSAGKTVKSVPQKNVPPKKTAKTVPKPGTEMHVQPVAQSPGPKASHPVARPMVASAADD